MTTASAEAAASADAVLASLAPPAPPRATTHDAASLLSAIATAARAVAPTGNARLSVAMIEAWRASQPATVERDMIAASLHAFRIWRNLRACGRPAPAQFSTWLAHRAHAREDIAADEAYWRELRAIMPRPPALHCDPFSYVWTGRT